jgi:hypothetical protein
VATATPETLTIVALSSAAPDAPAPVNNGPFLPRA